MPQVRIERTPIQAYALSYIRADHLLLTYVQDENAREQIQDNWYIIEGTLEGTLFGGGLLGVQGADGRTTLSEANEGLTGSALVAKIGTPSTRNSTVIEFPQGAFEAWDTMYVYAGEFEEQFLPYHIATVPGQPAPTSNSSSIIASVLYYAGVDIAQYLPTSWTFTTGTHTLIGTLERDEMFVTTNFTNLMGGRGSDILHGSTNTDRLSGGLDADLFFWSGGTDYIHGGQIRTEYARDGEDVMSYGGAGPVRIEVGLYAIDHRLPQYVAYYLDGADNLYSIERIQWNGLNDVINLGRGVEVLQDDILFDLKGDEGGFGDKVSFIDSTEDLLINAVSSDRLSVQSENATNGRAMFIDSAEWLEGSAQNDRIYANSGLRGIDGGGGEDFIDARLDIAFAGGSPAGYDIELYGGAGDDTLLTGEGRTLVQGGAGADRIVLTTINDGGGTPELIIDDADTDDRLFAAYNFFNGSGNGFEGSQLLPILGGMFPFELLQDPEEEGRPLLFEWQTMSDVLYGNSQVTGQINFQGGIWFTLDGTDLVITLYQGTPSIENVADQDSPPRLYELNNVDVTRETIIRVRDFEPGDLGIQFYDPGQPEVRETPFGSGIYYPNWDEAVAALTNNGQLFDPIDPRPIAPDYDPASSGSGGSDTQVSGSEGDDTITASLMSTITAGAGSDQITGSAFADRIDGGTGNDMMAGGAGNDTFAVDSAGDAVVEVAGGGVDHVTSTVDHTLAEFVENLELAGGAIAGTGNGLANTLVGNQLGNTLTGAGGNDTLSGDLGNDTLIGGAGSDGYVYVSGDGDDVVIDAGLASDIDTLILSGGIVAADVTFYRPVAAPGDLVMAMGGGGRVIIKDYAIAGSGIDRVTFDDGTQWTRAEIEAKGATAAVLGNDPPQAFHDDAIVASGPVGIVPAAVLLQNDRDSNGDALSITSVGGAVGGTVTLDADGDVRVETATGFDGLVTFTYTITDVHGATSTARVTVEVIANAAPVALGIVPDVTSAEDAALDFTVPAGIFGDPDGDPLAISASLADGTSLPAWLTFNAMTGRFTGTPPANFNGALAVRIAATDGLERAVHDFTLTITAVNDAPLATADTGFATAAGTPLLIAASALTINDSDIDSDTLTIAAVGGAIGGTVELEADGSVRFSPAPGFSGQASFFYTVSDGQGGTATATVSVNVTGAPGQTFAGTSGNDTITGTANNDIVTVVGDSGFDTINGGGGSDTIRGSVYNDIFRVSAPASYVSVEVIDGGAGNDRILGGTGNDTIDLSGYTLNSIEQIDGGAGNDTITGSAGDDVITGNTGNDTLAGGLGNDVFTLAGDGGNDIIDGGAGTDTIRGSISNDNIRVAAGVASITGIEIIDGGDGLDRILGAATNDVIDLTGIVLTSIEGIDGGAGNDTITGTAGDDHITGNVGNDILSGGLGNDVFHIAGDGGNDRVDGGGGTDTLRGSIYNDNFRIAAGTASITGIEQIEGGDGLDRILGAATDDVIDLGGIVLTSIEAIDAGGGNDTLVVSLSADVLTGGAGNDVFVFIPTGGHDSITDFQIGNVATNTGDKLDLRGLGFASFADVMAASYQVNIWDGLITIDSQTSIRLQGVSLSSLTADNVIV